MPPRSRNRKTYKKRPYKNIKKWRPSTRRSVPMRNMVYTFNRSKLAFEARLVNTSNTSGTAWVEARGMDFSLTELPNYSEFGTMFDQYRICGVKVTWTPLTNAYGSRQQGTGVNAPSYCPQLLTYIDLDDSTDPSIDAFADLFENSRVKVRSLDRPRSVFLRPRVINVIRNDTVPNDAYSLNPRKEWLDMGTPGILHYGLKSFINCPTVSTITDDPTFRYQLSIKYYFQCRHVR